MGKKIMILCGVVCVILVATSVPSIIQHYRIKEFVKDLKSEDIEIQRKAINALAGYGAEVVPRLILEIEQLPALENREPWNFILLSNFKSNRIFEYNLIRTFLKIGESSIPLLISRLSNKDLRFESFVICVIVFFYSDSAQLLEEIEKPWVRKTVSDGVGSTGEIPRSSFCTTIEIYKSKMKIYREGIITDRGRRYELRLIPSIVHLLKNLSKQKSDPGLQSYCRRIILGNISRTERSVPSESVLIEIENVLPNLKVKPLRAF